MLKRTFDILFSLTGLIILFPFFLLIILLIKINSNGPAFYLQERIGMHGKVFRLVKFRTMHVDADRIGAITVGRRDPRITRLGVYLRKYKIDELPQLINVLYGEMSLVGPRPELKRFVDLYNEDQLRVLSVRPGITDFASIQFRNENEMLEGKTDPIEYYIREILPVKVGLNLKYIQSQSVWTDFKIILNTVALIIKRK